MQSFSLAATPEIVFGNGKLSELPARITAMAGKGGTALAHNISHAMADLAPVPHGRAIGLAMLATIGWVKDGNRDAYAKVAHAMGEREEPEAAVSAYERLVRGSGIKISLIGDGLELNRPEKLAEHMASPANTPMRRSTARDISDDDLLMLAERVYALS